MGVAELCRAVGASKETLYRHFGSKDGLIEAVLDARSDRVVRWITEAVEAAGPTRPPNSRRSSACWATGTRNPASGGARSSTRPPSGTSRRPAPSPTAISPATGSFTGIAERAGSPEPALLGRQLLILLEGATVVADHHDPDGHAAQDARLAALALLDRSTQR